LYGEEICFSQSTFVVVAAILKRYKSKPRPPTHIPHNEKHITFGERFGKEQHELD